MNGSHRWVRRTVRILLGGVLAVPVALIFMLIVFTALWSLGWCYDVSRILFAVMLPVELCVFVLALRFLVRRFAKWGTNAEAERWLSERQTRANFRERLWRNRAVKFAVCIPAVIVLPIFLFLPETLGLVSHINQPYVADLSGYRVRTPWTWIVGGYRVDTSNGRSWVAGMAGSGIGRGVNPLRWDSVTGWTFGTKSYDGSDENVLRYILPKKYRVVDQRVFKIGSQQVTCIDYQPMYDDWPTSTRYQMIAHITCFGPGRFYASMDGGRREVGAFYEVLGSITTGPSRVLAP
jgi:hypothetical protein